MNSFHVFCAASLISGLLVVSFFLSALNGRDYETTWGGFGRWFKDALVGRVIGEVGK